jgi:hypothetical protein
MKTISNDKIVNEESSKDLFVKEIDLHIAEYNTLTTRATYFINIQFVLLTALIAWIVVIGQIWNPKIDYLLNWGLLLGSQIIGVINANMAWETFSIVRYIESDLKPKIRHLIKKDSFWSYESYLIIQRGGKFNKKWVPFMDFFWVVLAAFVFIGITIYRIQNWFYIDWLLAILNLLLLVFLAIRTYQTVMMKVHSWK